MTKYRISCSHVFRKPFSKGRAKYLLTGQFIVSMIIVFFIQVSFVQLTTCFLMLLTISCNDTIIIVNIIINNNRMILHSTVIIKYVWLDSPYWAFFTKGEVHFIYSALQNIATYWTVVVVIWITKPQSRAITCFSFNTKSKSL